MAITRPQTDTIISTTNWGIPITDAVNANTTDIAAMKPTAWTAPTLLNGWVNAGAPYQLLGYRKVGDSVEIRGCVKNGTTGPVFLLPVGFRPTAQQFWPIQLATQGQTGYASVAADGNLAIVASNVTFCALDPVRFSIL